MTEHSFASTGPVALARPFAGELMMEDILGSRGAANDEEQLLEVLEQLAIDAGFIDV